jgi:hypothetical protein
MKPIVQKGEEMKKVFASVTLFVIAVALALSMAVFPMQTVAASANQQQVTRTPISKTFDQQMSYSLQREQNWLMRQNLHLNQATQIAQKVQEAINKAQQAGLDVADLQNALDTFNSQLSVAQSSHDQAAAILASPAGFDANGNVTDSQVAHQTLASARDALQQAHLTLTNATLTLRTAFLNWRQTHNL